MAESLKKPVVTIFLLCLVLTPAVLFSYPKQASAQTSCVGAALSALGIGAVASKLISVPVSDMVTNYTTGGSFVSDCIIKPLIIAMAQRILANITNSLVTWIQNGFNGNPSFVTNIDDLMSNSANQAIGQFINSTALGKYLCQPFATQVRIALATSFGSQQYAGCTLTQIDQNLQNIGNTAQAWQSWINISTVPANNQYGAYVQASGILNDLLSTQSTNINNQINRNGGFLDYQVCDTYGPSNGVTPTASNPFAIDTSITAQPVTQNSSNPFAVNSTAIGSLPANTTDSWGVNPSLVSFPNQGSTQGCIHSHTTTPGQTISNALAGKYSSEFDQIGVANDINQIMGALVNEMISKTLTGVGGLLGGSTQSVSNTQNLSTTVSQTQSGSDLVNTLNSQVSSGIDSFNTTIANATGATNSGAVTFTSSTTGSTVIISKSAANTSGTYSLVISPTSSSTVIATPVSATITLTSTSGATAGSVFSSESLMRTINGQSVSLDPSGSLVNTGTLTVSNIPLPVEIDLSLSPSASSSVVPGTSFNFTVTLTDENGATLGTNTETFTIIP